MMPRLVTVCVLMTFGGAMSGQSASNGTVNDFGAKYATLKPEQKALIDDCITRFSATIHKQVERRAALPGTRLTEGLGLFEKAKKGGDKIW